jgi:HSP20 family protein
MAIIRWNPFNDLQQLQHEMNRLFDGTSRSWQPDEPTSATSWSPLADVLETEGNFVMKVELPGVDPDKVDVRLENNVLTVRGERSVDKEYKKESWLRMERPYGTFSRSFSMPGTIDEGKIKAEFKHGVLSIVLPKKEQAKPKQIAISYNNSHP